MGALSRELFGPACITSTRVSPPTVSLRHTSSAGQPTASHLLTFTSDYEKRKTKCTSAFMQEQLIAQLDAAAASYVAALTECPRTALLVSVALFLVSALSIRAWSKGRKFSIAAMARAVGAGGILDSQIESEVTSAVKTLFAPTDPSIPTFPKLPSKVSLYPILDLFFLSFLP